MQDSLLGEAPTNPRSKNEIQIEATTTANTLQDSIISEWLIPKDEFELMNDLDSLEDIIYDLVVEYQGIITSTIPAGEYVIEINVEPTERNPKDTILGNTSQPEPTTMSQVVISHEEEVSAQNFGEQSDEELVEWTEVLNNKADDEQWGMDGVHEEDMVLITRDRNNPTPTNNDCISNIYGYEEVDDPTIPNRFTSTISIPNKRRQGLLGSLQTFKE